MNRRALAEFLSQVVVGFWLKNGAPNNSLSGVCTAWLSDAILSVYSLATACDASSQQQRSEVEDGIPHS
jgi:hypothetical protein